MLKRKLRLKPFGAALLCPIRRPGLKTRLTDPIQKWALKTKPRTGTKGFIKSIAYKTPPRGVTLSNHLRYVDQCLVRHGFFSLGVLQERPFFAPCAPSQ